MRRPNPAGNAVLCLAGKTGELSAGLLSGAIEEVLRYLPPTGGTDRFTTVPTTLAATKSSGPTRIVMITAANRDPDVFPDPQRFDIRRTPNPHLSFGRGVHF